MSHDVDATVRALSYCFTRIPAGSSFEKLIQNWLFSICNSVGQPISVKVAHGPFSDGEIP
jgi:hypothetical protein